MKKLVKSRSIKRRRMFVLAAILAAALLGGLYYRSNLYESKVATGGEILEDSQSNEQPESEEDTVNNDAPVIPEGVSPDSIKNYELVTENELYKIRKFDGAYMITLYAIINRPDQAQSYRDQLKEYKSYALKYLEDRGVKTNNVRIDYEPQEATDL